MAGRKTNRRRSTASHAEVTVLRPQATDIGTPPGGFGTGYHAAESSSARTSFQSFPTNSLTETNRWTRIQMVQKKRALEANLPIIGRIENKIVQHAIGKGVFVQPATRDQEWNDLNRALFEEWASHPGVYSIDASRDHYQDQGLAAKTMVGDGEFFEALVNSENGAPMVQPFDVFEVESPGSGIYGFGVDDGGWVDGVRPNPYMRPIEYAVRELSTPGSWDIKDYRRIPADSMIHLFDRIRAKQMRGLTWFHSGINQGIDCLDLRALITGSAKLHESLAIVVNRTAKLNRKGALDKIKSAKTDGTPADDDFKALEKVYGGGLITYLGENGKVDLVASDRPSQNILQFCHYLRAEIASALRLPYQVVESLESLGGATARGALEDAQWLFEMIQDKVIWGHSYPIYRWRTARFMKEGRLRPCKDPYWWTCTWRGPAKLTVDLGRTADANIKLMSNAALSHPRYYDERGLNCYQEVSEEIKFRAWLKRECKANGVEPTEIIVPPPGTMTNVHMPEPPAA